MALMQDIKAYPVPKGSVGIWWLGQNGYIFKTPEGSLVSTDLYLTNACAHYFCDLGLDLERRVPVHVPAGGETTLRANLMPSRSGGSAP